MGESKRFSIAAGILALVFGLVFVSAGLWVYAERSLAAEWRAQAAQQQSMAESASRQIAVQNQVLNELRQESQRQRAFMEAMTAQVRSELATQRALIDQTRTAAVNAPQSLTVPGLPQTGTQFQPRTIQRRVLDARDFMGGWIKPQMAVGVPLEGRAWGPEQAVGEPNTPTAGDQQTAWASRTQDGQPEWLILDYAEAVTINRVKVHETYNPGALNKVSVFDDNGNEVVVWEGKDPTAVGAGMGVSEIVLATPRKSKKVKIYLDSVNVPGWNEIDAVGIVDDANKTHWAVGATASSTFAEQNEAFEPARRQVDADQGKF